MKSTAIAVLLMAVVCLAHGGEKHGKSVPAPEAEIVAPTAAENHDDHASGEHEKVEGHGDMEHHVVVATPVALIPLTDFPTKHPMIVHFPVVLLFVAPFFLLLAWLIRSRGMETAAFFLVVGGAAGAFVAGELVHPHTQGLTAAMQTLLENHEFWAEWTVTSSVLGTLLLALVLAIRSTGKPRFFRDRLNLVRMGALAVLVFAAVSVSISGHYGASLVHLNGVGPMGKYLELGHE